MEPSQQQSSEQHAGVPFVVVAGCVLCATMGLVFYLARLGFDNPVAPPGKAVLLGWLLQSAPLVWSRFSNERAGEPRWYTSLGIAPLGALLVLAAAGMLARWLGTSMPFLVPLMLLGAAGFAWALAASLRSSAWRTLILVVGAAAFGVWCAAVMWGYGYASPLFIESIATHTAPATTVDELFHTSIANMIGVHGVASTGLDGAVPLRYHVGSHFLFVQLAGLLGFGLQRFYQTGFAIVLIPLLFASVTWFGVSLAGGLPRLTRFGFWGSLVAGVIGVLPLPAQGLLAIGWWRLVSESYVVSLILGFALLSAVVAFCRKSDWQTAPLGDWRRAAFLFVVLPLGLCACGATKSSTLAVLMGAAGFAFLRLRLFRSVAWLVAAALSLALVSVTLYLLRMPEFARPAPLHFLRAYVEFTWIPLWPALYFLWPGIFIYWRLKQLGVANFADLRRAIVAGQTFDIELLSVVCVWGALPGLLIALPSQAGGYFSDPARWLGIGLVLAGFARLPSPKVTPKSSVRIELKTLVIALLALTVCANAGSRFRRFVGQNLATRRAVAGKTGRGWARLDGSLQRAIAELPSYRTLQQLSALDALPSATKRHVALFVPRDNRTFWELLPDCQAPLLGPALSGLPMVGGLPEDDHCPFFGYWAYHERKAPWSAGVLSGASGACQRARELGFDRVTRLEAAGATSRVRDEVCP